MCHVPVAWFTCVATASIETECRGKIGHLHPLEVLDAPVFSAVFEVGVHLQMARAPCSGKKPWLVDGL